MEEQNELERERERKKEEQNELEREREREILIRQGKKAPSVMYDLLQIEKTLNDGVLGHGSFKTCYKAQWTGMHRRS
jgi:hypothetical protein